MTTRLKRRESVSALVESSTQDDIDTFMLVLRNWLAPLTDSSQAAYHACLIDFARFWGSDETRSVFEWVWLPAKESYKELLAYKVNLSERKLSAPTINQRLSCLMSVSKAASKVFGHNPVSIELLHVPEKEARVVSNAQWHAVVRHLRQERDRATPGTRGEMLAVRMLAIVRLLRDVGLRRKEVVGLDYSDVVYADKVLVIQPKGPKEVRKRHPCDGRAWECLVEWMELRGDEPGPLFGFTHLSNLNKLVGRLGSALGFELTPHMFRHNATSAVEMIADRDMAQTFARHASPVTTAKYLHNKHEEALREIQRSLGEDEEEDIGSEEG